MTVHARSTRRQTVVSLSAVAGLVAVAIAIAQPATAGSADRHVRAAALPIPGSYIVVLADGEMSSTAVKASANTLTHKYGGSVQRVYGVAVKGYAAHLSTAQAGKLAADPSVAYVEQDGLVAVDAGEAGAAPPPIVAPRPTPGTQLNPPSWGLDRIDQRTLPLDASYSYRTTAANVRAYVIDTGIRTTHTTFGARASVGIDTVGDGRNGQDCNGHGTHVAGTLGGAEYGVAKAVRLVAVRVLDCSGAGSSSKVIAGIDWVTAHAVKPAVVNMSLGGSASTALDTAVNNSIASGLTYAVAAGNGNTSSCTLSPARVNGAITVSATMNSDARASYSNYGACTDVFAPGHSITSAWNSSDTATNTLSGTSMATPHVAGTVALYLSSHPAATPKQVMTTLFDTATIGVVTNAGSASPNRLLYAG